MVGLITFTMSSIGVAVPVQGGIGPVAFHGDRDLGLFWRERETTRRRSPWSFIRYRRYGRIVRIIRRGGFAAHQPGEQRGSGRCFVMNTRYVLNMN